MAAEYDLFCGLLDHDYFDDFCIFLIVVPQTSGVLEVDFDGIYGADTVLRVRGGCIDQCSCRRRCVHSHIHGVYTFILRAPSTLTACVV